MAARRKAAAPRAPRKPAAKAPAPRVRRAPRKAAAKPGTSAPRPGAWGDAALKLAGVGSEAVLRATGRAWDEWLKVLDGAGAVRLPHKDIAALLSRRFAVPAWWSQMVTVGYEQARGLRARNQKADGYAANASKTVAADLDKLYTAWSEPAQRSKWLPEAPLEIRRSNDGKSMRMTWTAGGSRVDVNFQDKGPGKSLVQVEHGSLPDPAAVAQQKAYWVDALARLKALLEKSR